MLAVLALFVRSSGSRRLLTGRSTFYSLALYCYFHQIKYDDDDDDIAYISRFSAFYMLRAPQTYPTDQ